MKSSLGPKRSEADVLSSCLKYLKVRGIFAMRMNVGGMKLDKRYVRFGVKGCADILAIKGYVGSEGFNHIVYWLECKSDGGKQSPAQKEFEKLVSEEGHFYYIVHSAAELSELL